MVYRGLVRDGVVVFEGGEGLPEGTVVRVEAVERHPGGPGGLDADHHRSEVGDRLLGVLRQTSAEGMRAQQRVDRVL